MDMFDSSKPVGGSPIFGNAGPVDGGGKNTPTDQPNPSQLKAESVSPTAGPSSTAIPVALNPSALKEAEVVSPDNLGLRETKMEGAGGVTLPGGKPKATGDFVTRRRELANPLAYQARFEKFLNGLKEPLGLMKSSFFGRKSELSKNEFSTLNSRLEGMTVADLNFKAEKDLLNKPASAVFSPYTKIGIDKTLNLTAIRTEFQERIRESTAEMSQFYARLNTFKENPTNAQALVVAKSFPKSGDADIGIPVQLRDRLWSTLDDPVIPIDADFFNEVEELVNQQRSEKETQVRLQLLDSLMEALRPASLKKAAAADSKMNTGMADPDRDSKADSKAASSLTGFSTPAPDRDSKAESPESSSVGPLPKDTRAPQERVKALVATAKQSLKFNSMTAGELNALKEGLQNLGALELALAESSALKIEDNSLDLRPLKVEFQRRMEEAYKAEELYFLKELEKIDARKTADNSAIPVSPDEARSIALYIQAEARSIIALYIQAGSDRQINISNALRKEIVEAGQAANFSPAQNFFDAARIVARELVAQNNIGAKDPLKQIQSEMIKEFFPS